MPTVSQALLLGKKDREQSPKSIHKKSRGSRGTELFSRSGNDPAPRAVQNKKHRKRVTGMEAMSAQTTQETLEWWSNTDELNKNLQQSCGASVDGSESSSHNVNETNATPTVDGDPGDKLFQCIFSDGSKRILSLSQLNYLQLHGSLPTEQLTREYGSSMHHVLTTTDLPLSIADEQRKMIEELNDTDIKALPQLSSDQIQAAQHQAIQMQKDAQQAARSALQCHLGTYPYPCSAFNYYSSAQQVARGKQHQQPLPHQNKNTFSQLDYSSSFRNTEDPHYQRHLQTSTTHFPEVHQARSVSDTKLYENRLIIPEQFKYHSQLAQQQQQQLYTPSSSYIPPEVPYPKHTVARPSEIPLTNSMQFPSRQHNDLLKGNNAIADLRTLPEQLQWINNGLSPFMQPTGNLMMHYNRSNHMPNLILGGSKQEDMTDISTSPIAEISRFPTPPKDPTNGLELKQYHQNVEAFLTEQNNRMSFPTGHLMNSTIDNNGLGHFQTQHVGLSSLPLTASPMSNHRHQKSDTLQEYRVTKDSIRPSSSPPFENVQQQLESVRQKEQPTGLLRSFLDRLTGDLTKRTGCRTILGCLSSSSQN